MFTTLVLWYVFFYFLETKRFISCCYDNPNLARCIPFLSYGLDAEKNETVIVIKRTKQSYRTPFEIATIIFSKMRKDIEASLRNLGPLGVVLVVPSCFNMVQRDAIKSAAEEAGLRIVRLINSTTAVASYYLKGKPRFPDGSFFLVYELGGGTFNVAIIKKNNSGSAEVIGMSGERFLGGIDFDNLILEHLCTLLLQNYKIQARLNKKLMQQLKTRSELAKICLSTSHETEIILVDILPKVPEKVFNVKITRDQFEAMADELINKTIDIVDCLLTDSKLRKFDIRRVVLSGGSTEIPKIKRVLEEYFSGKIVGSTADVLKAGVKGAAIQAVLTSKHPKQQQLQPITFKEVAFSSIGISVCSNLMKVIIKRNSLTSFSSYDLYTGKDQMDTMYFDVFEGERADCRKNYYITTAGVKGLMPTPAGKSRIHVEMALNTKGTLSIFAKQYYKNRKKILTMVYAKPRKSEAFLENTLKDAMDNKEQDQNFTEFSKKKSLLMNYCRRVLKALQSEDRRQGDGVCVSCVNTLKEAQDLQVSDEEKLDILWNLAKMAYDSVLEFQEPTSS